MKISSYAVGLFMLMTLLFAAYAILSIAILLKAGPWHMVVFQSIMAYAAFAAYLMLTDQ